MGRNGGVVVERGRIVLLGARQRSKRHRGRSAADDPASAQTREAAAQFIRQASWERAGHHPGLAGAEGER